MLGLTRQEREMATMKAHDDLDTCYLSYLLRLWRKRDGAGRLVWCASLEEPGRHQTARFGDLGALLAFLQGQLERAPLGERTPEAPLSGSISIDGD
jgi:hypothetical protein